MFLWRLCFVFLYAYLCLIWYIYCLPTIIVGPLFAIDLWRIIPLLVYLRPFLINLICITCTGQTFYPVYQILNSSCSSFLGLLMVMPWQLYLLICLTMFAAYVNCMSEPLHLKTNCQTDNYNLFGFHTVSFLAGDLFKNHTFLERVDFSYNQLTTLLSGTFANTYGPLSL